MTIDFINNLRTSLGLSFDEVISILGLHYGKTEWVVDDEIHEHPHYDSVISVIKEESSKMSKSEQDNAVLVLKHLKDCKAGKGIPVISTKPSREDLDRVKKWLKKGYSVEDFKIVNEYFVAKWVNTDNQQYLIPATLYKMGSRGGLGFTDKLTMAKESNTQSDFNIEVL